MQVYATAQELLDAVHDKLVEMHDEGTSLDFDFSLFIGAGGGHQLRPSNAGKCPRQLAYRLLYPEEREEIKSRTVSVFMHGDIHHEIERRLLSLVTPIQDIEMRVNFFVDGEIGFVPGNIDGQLTIGGLPYVLDVKSASRFSYADMERSGPREDHVSQLNAYMDATGIPRGLLWVINKDTAHRTFYIVQYDKDEVAATRERFRQVYESQHSDGEYLPPRMYTPTAEIRKGEPSGRFYLDWQCRYCDFTERCWGDKGFEMVMERNKPRWIADGYEEMLEEATVEEVIEHIMQIGEEDG